MKIYAICHDLKDPGRNYAPLHQAIKGLSGIWWRYLNSTWLVRADMSAGEIREILRDKINPDDNLLVIRVTREYAGWLPEKAWDWLRKYPPE